MTPQTHEQPNRDESLKWLVLHETSHDRLLGRIAVCTDVDQLRDARAAALLFDADAEIVAQLADKLARLTGIDIDEQPVRLSDIGAKDTGVGFIDERVGEAINALLTRCRDNGQRVGFEDGEAVISLKVTVEVIEGDLLIAVAQSGLKLPDHNAKGARGRLHRGADGRRIPLVRAEDRQLQLIHPNRAQEGN